MATTRVKAEMKTSLLLRQLPTSWPPTHKTKQGRRAMGGPHGPRTNRRPRIAQRTSASSRAKAKQRSGLTNSRAPSRHCVTIMTMMIPLPTWRSRVLRPKRAIQEMAARERRARHARDRRDPRAKGRRVRPAPAHAEREHAIEDFPFVSSKINQFW